MQKIFIVFSFLLMGSALNAQDGEGFFLKDVKTGCTVWYKHTFEEDSVTWTGKCDNNFADGFGTMTGFTNGKQTSQYIGTMRNGKPNGSGEFVFGNNRKLKGNFSNGEILNLKEVYLKHLYKNIVSETDSNAIYVGDNNAGQLYYHALIPDKKIIGALVLMPGTWETTEHLISSTEALCELAFENNLAVLALSINQRLTMTDGIVQLMNKMLADAISRYKIPKDKFVIGGWSMGGLFSLRYAEFANQDSTKTTVKPAAVFSCDGPCDLENIYNSFQRKLKKMPDASEPLYGISELEKYCGGSPSVAGNKYTLYSCYSYAQPDGGNAKYLIKTPVRIYNDVDPNWWIDNRNVDMYDMNALDQTAMILFLKESGNQNAAFINAFGKGYRIEGNRHPHSWSIIDAPDCINWILKSINQ